MGFSLLNDVYGTVATQSDAASASVVLKAGQGAAFAAASVDNPVRCAVVDLLTSPETVRLYLDVTGQTGDTLIVDNRGAEGSADAAILPNYIIAAVVTAEVFASKADQVDLAAEVTVRESGDTTNATAITAETSRAEAAETAEATARASAVTSEATARASADTTLTTNLTAEATARADADTTLTMDLAAEVTRAEGVEATEQANRIAGDALLIPLTQKAAANGVASLDGSGKVPQTQLPSVALTDFLGAVGSQVAMLALTGQRGDWCTRTDLGTDWQLIADDPTQLANWRQHVYPASPVSSVNGRTGPVTGLAENDLSNVNPATGRTALGLGTAATHAATDFDTAGAAAAAQSASQPVDTDLTTIAGLDVSTPGAMATDGAGWVRKTYAQLKTALGLVKADVGLGNVDNTTDANKPVSTAQQTALDAKLAITTAAATYVAQSREAVAAALGIFHVKNYGAKGDCKSVTDGAITSGTNVLACATSLPFVSSVLDVGKSVYIVGAGAAGADLLTTVTGFTDVGHVTLADNAATTVTAAIVTFATDDTAAWIAAIAAAKAKGFGIIGYDPVAYGIAGPFIQGGATLGNAQIPLPVIAIGSGTVNLEFASLASTDRAWENYGAIPSDGPLLVGMRPDGVYSGTYGPPSLLGGPTPEQVGGLTTSPTNVMVKIGKLGVRLPPNPTYAGVDLIRVAGAHIPDIRVDVADLKYAPGGVFAEPTHVHTFGLRMPSYNDYDVCIVDKAYIRGFYAGFVPGEHTKTGFLDVYGCSINFALEDSTLTRFYYGWKFDVINTGYAPYIFSGWAPASGRKNLPPGSAAGGGGVYGGLLTIERATTNWWAMVDEWHDTSNACPGHFLYQIAGNNMLTITGGALLHAVRADLVRHTMGRTVKQHKPTGITTYSTSSVTTVDIDATNLVVNVTFPASGAVRITLSATVQQLAPAGAVGGECVMGWVLREASADVSGTYNNVWSNGPAGSTQQARVTLPIYLTGTPGSTHTYKWGWAVINAGTAALGKMFAGTASATSALEASMTVEAVNLPLP